MNYNYLLIKKIKLEIIRILKVKYYYTFKPGGGYEVQLYTLINCCMLFLINKSYADQKQLVGADADYGEHLFGECVTCHNSTGLGQGIPKITGMKTSQFITKILAYKTKEKENAVMQMVAERLGEEEINSLALYLSKLK